MKVRLTDRELVCQSHGISVAGLTLATDERVEPGTLMRLDFRLPYAEQPLALIAKLERIDRSGERSLWVLSFVELPRETVDIIERYVERHRSDLPFSSARGRQRPAAKREAEMDKALKGLYSRAVNGDQPAGGPRRKRWQLWKR